MDIKNIIVESASTGTELLREDGSMPSGHNGPYHDPETPVRNTAHWLITFIDAYEETADEKYRKAAREASDYLLSDEARPQGYNFYHRKSESKNRCNGLIGPAWTIEALATAAPTLGEELAEVAREVFLLHPFHFDLGLWKPVEINGQPLHFDLTFNHQLWFAAAGGLLAQQDMPLVNDRVKQFLDLLEHNLNITTNGLIRHPLLPEYTFGDYKEFMREPDRWWLTGNPILSIVRRIKRSDKMIERAVGYHSFNLYALAILKECYPSHPIWDTTKVAKAINYALSEEYKHAIMNNPYGFPYNPPGFEIPYSLQVFDIINNSIQKEWISKQIEISYNTKKKLMQENTKDPNTHSARIYELTRVDIK